MGKSLRKKTVARKITTKQLKQIRTSPYFKRKREDAIKDINSSEFKEFMKKSPIRKKKVAKSKKALKRATAPKRLTKKQIEQLRNSPTLKRKLDRANKIFNSPEFKEFMEKYPPKRKMKS